MDFDSKFLKKKIAQAKRGNCDFHNKTAEMHIGIKIADRYHVQANNNKCVSEVQFFH